MQFPTPHNQRILVFTAALAGTVSLFLPWIKVSLFGFSKLENGLHGIGILVFSLFIATLLLSLVGDKKKTMDPLILGVNMVASAGALCGTLIFFYKASDSGLGISCVQFGLYVAALSAIAALIFAYCYRKSGTKGPSVGN